MTSAFIYSGFLRKLSYELTFMRKNSIRRKVGDVISIPLKDDFFAFGRVMEDPFMAFYDLRSRKVPSVDEIICTAIIFKVKVTHDPVKSGRWAVLGNAPLELNLLIPPVYFNQHIIRKNYTLIKDGIEKPATQEDCYELERGSIWGTYHIESRMNDHFEGLENLFVHLLSARNSNYPMAP